MFSNMAKLTVKHTHPDIKLFPRAVSMWVNRGLREANLHLMFRLRMRGDRLSFPPLHYELQRGKMYIYFNCICASLSINLLNKI
jgi:hypothetical protein